MLSSLKKPSDKSAVTVPAWHPNFRNFERLPDTKVVRTSFFTNGLAVFIACVLAVYVGYKEYALREMTIETENASSAIRKNKPASDQAVVEYKKFQEQEKKVLALRDFLSTSGMPLSDLILRLGSALPASITLNNIEYQSTAVLIRGRIEGASDEASGRAVAFVDTLRKDEAFSKLFGEVSLSSIVRDPGTGQMRFQIDLTFKSLPTKAVPKK
ncbi:PilN domain-containing protein [Rariglobus hedericola]|uniref:PilN domain-containing protein n=1 Tax=Rariglobus hedericola TaxID=2597822 RepID=A0A556QRH0_9BACT|nr:PilN domain-containing protein [Rariglobus hedericola]TSJ79222.1 PilN domain-containing protein [Rariglobus hedericola]